MFSIVNAQRSHLHASQRFCKDMHVNATMTKGTIMSIHSTIDRAKELHERIQSRVSDIQTLVSNSDSLVQPALEVLNMCDESDECFDKLGALCDRMKHAVDASFINSCETMKRAKSSLNCSDVLNTIMNLESCRDALNSIDSHVFCVLQKCNDLFSSDQLSLLKEAYEDCEKRIADGNNDGRDNILNSCIQERLASKQQREKRQLIKIEQLHKLLEYANEMSESLQLRIMHLQSEYDKLAQQCQQLTEDLTHSKLQIDKYKNKMMQQSICSSLLAGAGVAVGTKLNGASTVSAAASAVAAGASVGAMLYAYNMNNK